MPHDKLAGLKAQIQEIGNWLWMKNFVAGYDGNISVRLPDDKFLCTSTGISKGHLQDHHLVIVDRHGNLVAGEARPTSEIKLHMHIYKILPETQAIVHAHPAYSTAFAAAGFAPHHEILPEVENVCGKVGFAHFAKPGTEGLCDRITPLLENNITSILLERHGAVTASTKSALDAYFQMEKLEAFCKTIYLANSLKPDSVHIKFNQ